MKKRRIIILPLIVALLLFLSCSNNHRQNFIQVSIGDPVPLEIIIPKEQTPPYNLSSVIDTFYWVPLETRSESMLGRAFSVAISENFVNVFDDFRRIAFTFSLDGSFLFHPYNIGRGPKEISSAMSLYYDEQLDKLIVPDAERQSLHIISTDGKYERNIHVGHYIAYITRTGPEHHALYCYDSNSSSIVIAYDNLTRFAQTDIKLKYNTTSNISPFNKQANGSAYFTYRFYDTILSISADTINIVYTINSGREHSERIDKMSELEIVNSLNNTNKSFAYDFNNIYESSSIMYYRFTNKNIVYQTLINKTRDLRTVFTRSFFAGHYLSAYVPIGNGWFYAIVSNYKYSESHNLSEREIELNNFMNEREIDDNPVLVFFKFNI
jgi:hypothetical protein